MRGILPGRGCDRDHNGASPWMVLNSTDAAGFKLSIAQWPKAKMAVRTTMAAATPATHLAMEENMFMRLDIFRFSLCFVIGLAGAPAFSQGLAELSNRDAVAGLKEALAKGSQAAVQKLGVEDGFLGNERVKIPLPDSLARVERLMRGVGMGRYADELVTRMNRAAEAAVPEARALLVNSIKQMSVQDAKGILSGGDDAATQYFKRTTSGPLAQKFLPIVKKAMERVKLAEKYNEFAERGSRFGLIGKEDANLENYITRKALDGLYFVIAEEEKKIRQDPVGAASDIIKKVFGALKR